MKKLLIAMLTIVVLCGFTEPGMENLTAGMNAYLEKHGNLCLAKNAWPIDVTQQEMDSGARNAIQMPVLEKKGIVKSSIVPVKVRNEESKVEIKVMRYELTETGRKYYLERPMQNGDGTQQRDLCPVRINLDKVVAWEGASPESKGREIVVRYTYKVDAAPWVRDPEVEKAFPAMAHVVHGAGTAQLKEAFEFTAQGWQAKD